MPPRKRARAESSSPAAADGVKAHTISLPDDATERHSVLRSLYEAGELCDGEVVLGDRIFPVSRITLAGASEFFRAAFTGGMRESSQSRVTLDDSMSAQSVEALLLHAHAPGGSFSVDLEAFIVTADQLGFTAVLPAIARLVADTTTFSNLGSRLALAHRLSLDAVLARAVELLSEHAADFCRSPGFVALPCEVLRGVLAHERLFAEERILWEGVLAWHANAQNDAAFEELIELMRFTALGTSYLISHAMHADAVMRSERARALVQEALIYLTDSSQRAALASPRTQPRLSPLHRIASFTTGNADYSATTEPGSVVLRRTNVSNVVNPHLPIVSDVVLTAPVTSWKVKMEEVTREPNINPDGFICVGVIATATPSAESFKDKSSYGWGCNVFSYAAGQETGSEDSNPPDWQTGDELTLTLDKPKGTLTLHLARTAKNYVLAGLDSSLDWRLHFCTYSQNAAVRVMRG